MNGRRDFLKKAALGTLGFSVLPLWAANRQKGPNDKLGVAFVGVGGRGWSAVRSLCNYDRVRPIVFCDVDDITAEKSYKAFPDVPRIKDYRRMFDQYGKDIDAVVISTPDHAHYPIAAWAMAAGKHVYVEKPMTRTIWESRDLRRIAAKTGVVTQLGNQGHGMGGWRSLYEYYVSGLLGEVEEICIWTDRPVWHQGPFERPDGSEKVPATLDYDLWLNVAPHSPYSAKWTPFHWRGLRDYGTGAMGDHACHAFDWPYSALDLGMPDVITGSSSEYNDFGWPAKMKTVFEFPAKGKRPRVKMHWLDGSQKPQGLRRIPQEVIDATPNGAAVIGTKESAICFDQFGERTMISPRERMVELKKSNALPAEILPRLKEDHHRNWVNACLDGTKATSDIVEYAAQLNEFVLLGSIPMFFPDTPLKYDAALGKFTNEPKANDYFNSRYQYRGEFLPGKI